MFRGNLEMRVFTAPVAVVIGLLAFSSLAVADRSSATVALAEANASVRAAERNGASELAPIELKAARDNLAAALVDADNRRWNDAERSADRALRDAELADAKARAAKAEQSRQELESVVETLRRELALDGEES